MRVDTDVMGWVGIGRRGISPLAAAPMPGAVVSLAPEERAVILDRIKQEISASQKINEEAFAMLSSRLTALEATPAGARGVRFAISNANVNPHADVRAHAPGEPLLAHPVCGTQLHACLLTKVSTQQSLSLVQLPS
jgi:hypothetical protein